MAGAGTSGRSLPPDIRAAVLEAVRPTPDERARIEERSIALLQAVEGAADAAGLRSVRCVLSGSVAKGTYMKDPDLDIFVLFPLGTDLGTMKLKGLEVASKVLESPRLSYAQHPYMTGRFMGLTADIVPGIDIPEGSRVVTAVDRTQHHTRYINSRLPLSLRDDVLLLKSFLKGIGAYGAEDTANGFSGYLVELVVLWTGGFDAAIEWLSSIPVMRAPPKDMEELGVEHVMPGSVTPILFRGDALAMDEPLPLDAYVSRFGRDPLVIVDPTDRERNVASPVSGQTLAHAATCAREMISSPSPGTFHPFTRRPRGLVGSSEWSHEGLFALDLPEGNPSRVASQVRRSLTNLSSALLREGFSSVPIRFVYVFREGVRIDPAYLKSRATWTGKVDKDMVLFRVDADPSSLPRTYRHWGPPVENRQAPDFLDRWKGKDVKVEDGRYLVELSRSVVDPLVLTMELWSGLGHGPDIAGRGLSRYPG